MRDSFVRESAQFLRMFDALHLDRRASFADFPPPEQVRPVLHMAEFIRDARGNPFRNWSRLDLLLCDLADGFLTWAADPGNPRRWERLFEIRVEFDDAFDDDDMG